METQGAEMLNLITGLCCVRFVNLIGVDTVSGDRRALSDGFH